MYILGIMNILSSIYCRTFQQVMHIAIPFLPYRSPVIWNSVQDQIEYFKSKNISRVLLVTDKGIRNEGLTKKIGELNSRNGIQVTVFDDTHPNPTTSDIQNASKLYNDNNCQALIGFGGGSSIDCAKAVGISIAYPGKPMKKFGGILKVQKKIPLLVAIPTTAGTGSETTLAAVVVDSDTRHKYAINSFPLIPKFAILDPENTFTLPPHLTSTTGMDALTHAVEAFIGQSTTKQTRRDSLEATKLIFQNIQKAYENGKDPEARKNMLHAAFLAGRAFTVSYVGYVHAVAHSLGGKYNIPHGLANSVLLPIVLEAYGKSVWKKLKLLGVAAGVCSPEDSPENGAKKFIESIKQLNKSMNIPQKLDNIQDKDIPALAKKAAKEGNPLYPVPKLFTSKQLEKFYNAVQN